MRHGILAGLLLLSSAMSWAADGFTCEKIKEKALRASCVASRNEAAQRTSAENIAKDAERAELEDFVGRAKTLLVRDYKDPQSAQFQDLVIATTAVTRTLCGSVNAKNSYGGYVGFKRFSVQFFTDPRVNISPSLWYEGESTEREKNSRNPDVLEAALKLDSLERAQAKERCSASDSTKVISAP